MTTQSQNFDARGGAARAVDYEAAVDRFYELLYRFAFGLTANPADAADLTQDTFHTLLLKSGQIRDTGKLKSWLFSTLYRRFLGKRRRIRRFPEVSVEGAEDELPTIDADSAERLDTTTLLATLQSLQEKYRVPLVMHYLQEFSYREIAEVLSIPIGTVMSRLSRGKDILRRRLETSWQPATRNAGPAQNPPPAVEALSGRILTRASLLPAEPAWGVCQIQE